MTKRLRRTPDEEFRYRRKLKTVAVALFVLSTLISTGLVLSWIVGAQADVGGPSAMTAVTPSPTGTAGAGAGAIPALPDTPAYAICALVLSTVSTIAGVLSLLVSSKRA